MASYPFLLPDAASLIARDIYALSQECLMAHSIRASELYLTRIHRRPQHITLTQVTKDMTLAGRNSHCHPGDPKSRIYVMNELDHDEKRFWIAHELYHIIVYAHQGLPPRDDQTQNEALERICDIFARELCSKHDAFYRDQQQIQDHCQFKNLDFNSLK